MIQKSLSKALCIIDLISKDCNGLGISEISHELGLNKSNVSDILSTFEKFGYISKNQETKKYNISYKFLTIAHTLSNKLSFQNIIHQKIIEISQKIDEIIYFAIPYNHEVLYITGSYNNDNSYFRNKSIAGMTAPLTCTGIGKAMLAHMSEESLNLVLEQPLVKFTKHTIIDKRNLLIELNKIKEQGYSVDNMEHEHGVKCVAVPLFNHSGELIGGISVTGPSLRFPESTIRKYAQILINSAYEIKQSI